MFKIGDKVRLRVNEDNQAIQWTFINYLDVYEISNICKEGLTLKGLESLARYSANRFELVAKKEEEKLYFLVVYNKSLFAGSAITLEEILETLNFFKPEERNIRLYRWYANKPMEYISTENWPFTYEEVVKKEMVFKKK